MDLVGTAVGMAINGLIPVVEIQFSGFTMQAFDQIEQNMARMRNRTQGRFNVSMVMRAHDDLWPKRKTKRRPRQRIIAKKGQPDSLRKAAEPAPLPPGKDTVVINGRELPKQGANEVRLTPAQLPQASGKAQDAAKNPK